jgi:dolichyldiphosphatase
LACAGAVAASRIYLSYHTPKQVIVGCTTGVAFALAWFAFTTYLRRAGWIDWALETWVLRLLRVRDLVIQEDLVDSGWARWEDRRRRRIFQIQGIKSR